jgi:hypothetical protein
MTKRWVFWFIVLLLAIPAQAADECDCDHFPWEPECVSICGARILNMASARELKVFLDLDEDTASRIVNVREEQPLAKFESLEGLQDRLSGEQFEKIREALVDLGPLQAEYLLSEPAERRELWEAAVEVDAEWLPERMNVGLTQELAPEVREEEPQS